MIKSLLQFDDVRPACGGVRTLEIMLDGVGKNIGFAFAIFPDYINGGSGGSCHLGLGLLGR